MITKEVILKLHELSIVKYGGSQGIRDEGLMESAIAESIIINHPFVDGNKRTGYLAMLAILDEGKLELSVPDSSIYSFIIKISTGEIKFEEIVGWLKQKHHRSLIIPSNHPKLLTMMHHMFIMQ